MQLTPGGGVVICGKNPGWEENLLARDHPVELNCSWAHQASVAQEVAMGRKGKEA